MTSTDAPRARVLARIRQALPLVGPGARRGLLHPLGQVLLIALVFVLLRDIMMRWPFLHVRSYADSVFILTSLTTAKPCIMFVFAVAVAVAVRMRGLTWRHEKLSGLRIVAAGAVASLAWACALYPFNHNFGQAHLLERLLLLALAALAIAHPAFVSLFSWLLMTILGQFFVSTPLEFGWADLMLALDVLMLLVVALALSALGLVHARGSFFALLVLTATHYFDSARLKWKGGPHAWDWALENDITNLFVWSHANGWLADISDATVLTLTAVVAALAVPLQILTFLLEGAAVLLLSSRRFAMALLACFIAMHLGILAASGIFFWKWIVIDVALIVALSRLKPAFKPRWLFIACAPLLIFSHKLEIANGLGWWDTRLDQYTEMWAVTSTGERWRIDEADFAPYDKPFAQDRFDYLHAKRVLVTTCGTTSSYVHFRSLQQLATRAEVHRYLARGRPRTDAVQTERFDRFVRRFVSSRNRRRDDLLPRVLSALAPPMHIHYRAPSAQRLPRDAVVTSVEVVLHQAWFDGTRAHELSAETVHTVQVRPLRPTPSTTSTTPGAEEREEQPFIRPALLPEEERAAP